MIVSLRIMNFGFLISVIVAVLIIGKSLEASAQGTEVECPCDFESVPMTTGCWTEQFPPGLPVYNDLSGSDGTCSTLSRREEPFAGFQLAVGDGTRGSTRFCSVIVINPGCGCTQGGGIQEGNITHAEVLACQCELLAYTTALNEVAGIPVGNGPPYECGHVDLQTCQGGQPTPIPTLNEYGMIITAGVLGLLAVIGLFVIRRRKVSA
jgi:hypothetical protein